MWCNVENNREKFTWKCGQLLLTATRSLNKGRGSIYSNLRWGKETWTLGSVLVLFFSGAISVSILKNKIVYWKPSRMGCVPRAVKRWGFRGSDTWPSMHQQAAGDQDEVQRDPTLGHRDAGGANPKILKHFWKSVPSLKVHVHQHRVIIHTWLPGLGRRFKTMVHLCKLAKCQVCFKVPFLTALNTELPNFFFNQGSLFSKWPMKTREGEESRGAKLWREV